MNFKNVIDKLYFLNFIVPFYVSIEINDLTTFNDCPETHSKLFLDYLILVLMTIS